MTPPQREWPIGEHLFHFEPPDLLWAQVHGGCSLPEAIRMADLYRELGTVQPFFLLCDMERAGGIESEARRHVAEHVDAGWVRGAIYIKTRLLHKATATGLILASEIFREQTSPLQGKIHFVPTAEEARALVAQLRARDRGSPG